MDVSSVVGTAGTGLGHLLATSQSGVETPRLLQRSLLRLDIIVVASDATWQARIVYVHTTRRCDATQSRDQLNKWRDTWESHSRRPLHSQPSMTKNCGSSRAPEKILRRARRKNPQPQMIAENWGISTVIQSTDAVKDSLLHSCVAKQSNPHHKFAVLRPVCITVNSLCVWSANSKYEFLNLIDTNVNFPEPDLVLIPHIFATRTNFSLTPLYSFPLTGPVMVPTPLPPPPWSIPGTRLNLSISVWSRIGQAAIHSTPVSRGALQWCCRRWRLWQRTSRRWKRQEGNERKAHLTKTCRRDDNGFEKSATLIPCILSQCRCYNIGRVRINKWFVHCDVRTRTMCVCARTSKCCPHHQPLTNGTRGHFSA